MAKKTASAVMNRAERTGGTIFFLIYFCVLPFFGGKILDLAAKLLDVTISETMQNAIYYYLLFAVTLLLFHSYLAEMTRRFFENMNRTLLTVLLGLLAFYGANEMLYRVSRVLFEGTTNLNDQAIAAQISAAPRMTALVVIALAPFVEEVLFRGLVFGCVREKSRVVAYLFSCALFAFLHVWTFAFSAGDLHYFVLMLQYLVPGFLFAWCYDRSGTLWASVLLHAAVNALSLLPALL